MPITLRHSLYDACMTWRDELVNRLSATVPCGYERRGPAATEPTCLSAIALFLEGRSQQSLQALQWLSSLQNDDGSVGPTAHFERRLAGLQPLQYLHTLMSTRSGSTDVLGVSDEANRLKNMAPFPKCAFARAEAIEWLIATKPDPPKKSDLARTGSNDRPRRHARRLAVGRRHALVDRTDGAGGARAEGGPAQ